MGSRARLDDSSCYCPWEPAGHDNCFPKVDMVGGSQAVNDDRPHEVAAAVLTTGRSLTHRANRSRESSHRRFSRDAASIRTPCRPLSNFASPTGLLRCVGPDPSHAYPKGAGHEYTARESTPGSIDGRLGPYEPRELSQEPVGAILDVIEDREGLGQGGVGILAGVDSALVVTGIERLPGKRSL